MPSDRSGFAYYYTSRTASWRQIAARVATFPPLIALLLALAASPVPYPAWLGAVFAQLGATLTPLALVSVGLQLRLEQFRGNGVPLSLGLAYKLVVGPLLILLLYWEARGWDRQTLRVTIFEAAMGPQIGGGIVAMQYGLNPGLITLMIGLGIALSFLTLPLWHLGLKLIWRASRALARLARVPRAGRRRSDALSMGDARDRTRCAALDRPDLHGRLRLRQIHHRRSGGATPRPAADRGR